ncbi:MAG: PorT family protein, partial [Tannerellaceae bacterium]|nr:PorT family protein [Tannerellaceae bacterium]
MRRLFFTLHLFTMLISGLMAQKETVKNQPYADMRLFHLGFHLGLHTQDLIFTHTGAVSSEGESRFAEIPSYSSGFSVGIIGDMFVNPYLNLRVIPSIHFGDKQFVFREQSSGTTYTTPIRSNYITLPIELKYTSLRLNNYRPYLTGGIYGALDVGRKKEEALLLKSIDYGISAGLGCDIYLPFFKLCPELKFMFGFRNLIEKNRTDLT